MLTLKVAGTGEELSISPERLVIAGYTARDEAAVAEHIAELAAIGVPAPPSVPAFYDLSPALLTTEEVVRVDGDATSGEVEPVLVRRAGRYYLAVGSDHTDRELERTDIHAAKAACPKTVGETVVELGSDLSNLDWDGMTAESEVDGQRYQHGSIAVLRHPEDTLARMATALGPIGGDLVMYCGTLPLINGEFVPGQRWQLRLRTSDGTELRHSYLARRGAH